MIYGGCRKTVEGSLGRLAAGLSAVGLLAVAGASGCTDRAASADPIRAESRREAAGEGSPALQSAEACLTIQRGAGVGDVFDSGINDNGVSSNNNSGTSGTIPIGDSGNPATPRQELMRFDLSLVPPGAGYTVTYGQVALYFYPNSANQTIYVHQATAAWGENTVSWPSFGESFVATPVTSFNAGAKNSFPSPNPPNNVRFDIAPIVSGWLNNAFPEDGILLEQPPVAGVSTVVLTSEFPPSNSGYHPTLFLCFTVTCAAGTADCDHDGLDGCETDITTLQNCGGCGNVCNLPNAAPACVDGACTVGSCNPGYSDCDGNPANGCEPLPCGDGQHCTVNADCRGGFCTDGICQAPAFTGVSAVDLVCGGTTAASESYAGVLTIGEPAGAGKASSAHYALRGGFVGATQGP